MATTGGKFSIREHDWQSRDYVHEWIKRDVTRDGDRRPDIRRMLSLAPIPRHRPLHVLDVGAGYGVISEEVLRAFPRALVTLQDYSQPMLAQSRTRLARYKARTRFVHCNLLNPAWTDLVGGPFDIAVSGLAIHNLQDAAQIAQCYRGIHNVLRAGGWFLDYDHFDHAGGLTRHTKAMEAAGFKHVECAWHKAPTSIVRAARLRA